MKTDYILITIMWLATIGLLILFIPKNKIREAVVIFLFKQLLTWSLGIMVVQLGLIEYPVRLFPDANKTSFTFEFFVYPAICAVFNLNFPEKKSYFLKIMHYAYYCTVMTILEIFTERYTNIIKYIHWEWYVTWLTLLVTFYITRKFYMWFFKLNKSNSEKEVV